METLSLFQELADSTAALKAAVKADVEVAGGFKAVASELWPEKDPLDAQKRLMNACNPKQKQELDYHEIQKLKLLARTASGASHVHAYESKSLDCKLHWATLEEQSQEAATCLMSAMQVVTSALAEAQKLAVKLERAGKAVK